MARTSDRGFAKDISAGFTLIEILVVITIVLILLGLIMPALMRARTDAYIAADTSNLHQIGLAQAIYQDSYGEQALSLSSLIDSGLLDKKVAVSGRDSTKKGLAWELSERMGYNGGKDGLAQDRKYRISYIAWGGALRFKAKRIDNLPEGSKNFGWLISLIPSDLSANVTSTFEDHRYLRLTMEGSVLRRPAEGVFDDGTLRGSSPIFCYIDCDSACKKKLLSP
ncbi:MAG TPA: type II secretion system protein [Fimbriimonadaceae bacterium]|nr:type II secretion system protein [Fimbriimonadaceae bacterium]